MLRGLYSAASGMMTQQRVHDTVSNNIANLDTPGYKGMNAPVRSFPELLIALRESGQSSAPSIGRLHTGVFAEESWIDFSLGDLQETHRPFDFALISDIEVPGVIFDESGRGVGPNGETIYQPQAFFTVANENGEQRFTRDGQFMLNETGELVTHSGYRVLDRNGAPIVLDNGVSEFRVSADGILFDPMTGTPLLNADGEPIQLLISRVDNPHRLVREGNGLFRLEDPDNPAQPVNPGDRVEIRQGWLERSNVNPIRSMVQLMTALRAYEANQKVIQFYDQSLDKAVNVVGRIGG